MQHYKRIAIIGISAAGKSTLSFYLSKNTGLPVFHLDAFIWKGNWRSVPRDDYLLAHKAVIEKREWIIEGYIDREMADRLRKADLVLFLDYPGVLCFLRAIHRWWKHRNKSRPELPSDALDQFDLKLFLRILIRAQRKEIEEVIHLSGPARVVRLRSKNDLDKFIMNEIEPSGSTVMSDAYLL
jgi:adenylate kinase family enzyme